MDWPQNIRAFRAKHNFTQAELATVLECSIRTIQDWEGGRRTPPNFLKLAFLHIESD